MQLIRYINENQILEPLCITTPNDNERILTEDSSEGILQSWQKVSGFWCRVSKLKNVYTNLQRHKHRHKPYLKKVDELHELRNIIMLF